MTDSGPSLEVHNQGDQYLDSKTSDQACQRTVDHLRSASLQVIAHQVHQQRPTALHLLLGRPTMATALI
jgi:hypothetical protein